MERQSTTESEESSDSSEEDQASAERSRPLIRSASPRRSASPMRRVQIGRTGSRRATALTIKSLNLFPARDRTFSHGNAAGDSSDEEGSQHPIKRADISVQRMSVQDAINLFESKQKDQTTDSQKRNSLVNALGNKSVLRRWSAGMGESCSQSEPQISADDPGLVISNGVTQREDENNSVEVKSESSFISGDHAPADNAEVDVQLNRYDEQTSNQLEVEAESDDIQREEVNERLTASAEWSRQKEMELNQMLKKMMETQQNKTKKIPASKKQNHSFEQRGGFYEHYKEKRDEKLRGENARKKAEKEAQFKAMKQILEERKAEMASKNVNDVGKKQPLRKPQKPVKELPKSNLKKETPKPTATKKVPSKTSTLPATRKSWPATPSPRTSGTSPAKTSGGLSSSGTTPTRRKSQPPTVSRPNPMPEKPRQAVRKLKESPTSTDRSLKDRNEKKQQTVARSSKTTKPKVATASADSSGVVPAKPSFYNKVTKKGSVVPLESKPFLRKGSGIGSGVGPASSKTKSLAREEESLRKSGNLVETQETEVVDNASSLVREDQGQDIVSLGNCDAAMEMETKLNDQQMISETECFNPPAANNEESSKDTTEFSLKVQTEEESAISPSAWVEIEEEENQDLQPIPCHDNNSNLTSPANAVPREISSPRVRHSLSQMLQEESSEADATEWGNAENPPPMIYQKDAPKGLKRLLKFARKSKGDASSTGWSSPSVFSEGEDDSEDSKAASRRNADNLLRKAALQATNYNLQRTSLSDDYLKSVDAHLLSGKLLFPIFFKPLSFLVNRNRMFLGS